MQTKSLYLSTLQEGSGSFVAAIGFMQLLKSKYHKVAFFRPVIKDKNTKDSDIVSIQNYFSLKMDYDECYGYCVDEVEDIISNNNTTIFYETILDKVKKLEEIYDFVLIEGIAKSLLTATVNFDINLTLCKHISSPFISILNCKNKEISNIIEDIKIEEKTILQSGCIHFGTIANRIDSSNIPKIRKYFLNKSLKYELNFLPQIDELEHITIEQVMQNIKSKHIFSDKSFLQKTILNNKIACMGVEHFIKHIKNKDLIITSGDRVDIIMTILALHHTKEYQNIAAIILTGDIELSTTILNLLKSYENLSIPILTTPYDTYTTSKYINQIKPTITYKDKTKIASILGYFSKYIDSNKIELKLLENNKDIVTPLMFQYNIFKKARKNKKTIVLPESFDDRILKAVEISINSKLVNIILLGDKKELLNKATSIDIDISKATIIDPKNSQYTKIFSSELYKLRKSKGLLEDEAYNIIQNDLNYFATMLVHFDIADGMVSGAVNTTANTVRPALQIIKTKSNSDVVSSLFFMCFNTKVLVYADCAINQDPSASDLKTIAIDTSNSAKSFNIESKIAMLSYSTGTSGSGKDVDKIKEATKLIKQANSSLIIDGPIQYDAATNKIIAAQKLPQSKIQGDATIFIFPDLNTGNNTYKAVRDSSGAVAIGPILQGLNKPINDLSRGCIVDDIVNTIAITAIQAN
ncbi:MAG: phosphate acetyltransferase [Campylobacterota bacterium]|nr:phosphate acetyltransferase [Campylobacterota bacterium]